MTNDHSVGVVGDCNCHHYVGHLNCRRSYDEDGYFELMRMSVDVERYCGLLLVIGT